MIVVEVGQNDCVDLLGSDPQKFEFVEEAVLTFYGVHVEPLLIPFFSDTGFDQNGL